MAGGKMHADELEIDLSLVQSLLAVQFPQWAGLPVERVLSAGTDNAIFRLGEDMAVRMPRVAWSVGQVERESLWLPKLAPHLPVAIPLPLAKGAPDENYPWDWSVVTWLQGKNATPDNMSDPAIVAADLANFVHALQQIDPADGPRATTMYERGVPLALRDEITRKAISELETMQLIDVDAVTAAWAVSLYAPAHQGDPVWIHGDLQSGNLLVQRAHLSGVIDFGCMGIGDPACDYQVAWNLFSPQARAVFRDRLQVDDAAWARGRGWALSVALLALPYYKNTNPTLAGIAQYTIDQVLSEI